MAQPATTTKKTQKNGKQNNRTMDRSTREGKQASKQTKTVVEHHLISNNGSTKQGNPLSHNKSKLILIISGFDETPYYARLNASHDNAIKFITQSMRHLFSSFRNIYYTHSK